MSHTDAAVIEPAGLCGRCLHSRRATGRDPRRDSVNPEQQLTAPLAVGGQPGGQVGQALEDELPCWCGSWLVSDGHLKHLIAIHLPHNLPHRSL
jgi:hypothetical protein